jgi:hypothetical protein
VLYGDAGAYPSFDWSARAAGHAATLAESRNTSAFLSREVDIQELLRTNDDSPWERIFQFRPFGVDVFGAYGGGATAILQQLTRNRSGQTSLTVGACGRLAFQSLRVALQTANSRMLRSRKVLASRLFPSSLNYQDQRACVGIEMRKTV